MRTIFVCAALAALAACGSQEPEPQPTQTVTALPVVEPSLPAPDEAVFAAAFAEACPNAQKVSTSLCKSEGLGKDGFVCEYGLGDDEYRRNKTHLVPGDGKWAVADPAKTCAADQAA